MPALNDDLGHPLSVSIVICTNGRAQALRTTLSSLAFLDYPNFEVCVVHGPTEDGTRELLASYTERIKVAGNSDHNLSVSRNIGIALAAGEVVAFLDDDAIPESEWLRDLVAAYGNPDIGGVGGFVYDPRGTDFQFRFSTIDRLARSTDRKVATPGLCFPLTTTFPHMVGANCSFRRKALLDIHGFDEEFEYYLDETDVELRVVDAGYEIEVVDGAYVHHKVLPSSLRSVEGAYRTVRNWYPIVKNKIYFCLRHGTPHYGHSGVITECHHFIDGLKRDMLWAKQEGYLDDLDERRFQQEVDQAWADGLARGLANHPRLLSQDTLRQWASPFLQFAATVPSEGCSTYCFVSQEYTVGKMGGIGRYTHELAEAIAAMGHHAHVITLSQDYDRVDFEQGVWVHRVLDRPPSAPQPGALKMPWYRWGRASTVLETVDAINAKRPVKAVSAPIWDCEGIALAGKYPLATTLHTSMVPWLASNPMRARDKKFMREHARPMIAAETYLVNNSDRIVANSQAIADEIRQFYDVPLEPERVALIPHGLSDWLYLPREEPPVLSQGALRMVYVGRLEERKGIDVLLRCAPRLLARYPNLHLDLVGDDTIPGPKGRTWRQVFQSNPQIAALGSRMIFHGIVSDERLRGFYATADILVAPSRFESFGLMLVEGMQFAKPVVGCRTGGMVEVVEDGVSGLLAEPGDEVSLEHCLEQLIIDPSMRARMGVAARKRYEDRFTVADMARAHVAAMDAASASWSLNEAARSAEPDRDARGTASPSIGSARPAIHLKEGTSIEGRTTTPDDAHRGGQHSVKQRIVIIAPMLARYDGISNAVRDTYHMLAPNDAWDVAVLTMRNDFPDVPAKIIKGVSDLIIHPAYLEADLMIYHFGMFNDVFNALLMGNGHARQAVVFHNVTPKEFIAKTHWSVIEDSFRQIINLGKAEEVWAVSMVNGHVAEEHGVDPQRIRVIPSAVDTPVMRRLCDKMDKPTEILFVGRIVPAKGVLDIIQAAQIARRESPVPFCLRVAGSMEWSDQEYAARVKQFVSEHHMNDIVQFCGTVDDAERDRLYHAAHILAIPSYHEGFCKPVVEALRSGCIPVGYNAYNLPFIVNGFGRLVAPGDVPALASALIDVLSSLSAARSAPETSLLPLDGGAFSPRALDEATRKYVESFTSASVGALTVNRVKALLAQDSHGVSSLPLEPESANVFK